MRINAFSELIKKVQENPLNHEPQEIADEILKLIGYDKERATSVPIVDIAKNMGFAVRVTNELPNNDSGFILISPSLKEKFNSTKCIFLSKKIKYGKSRFVIAHEIGHYLYDFNEFKKSEFSHIYSDGYNKNTQEEPSEQKANKFAAALLMPKDRFSQRYTEMLDEGMFSKADVVYELSNAFEITTKSVDKRIKGLELA